MSSTFIPRLSQIPFNMPADKVDNLFQTIYAEQDWRHRRLRNRLTCPKTGQTCSFAAWAVLAIMEVWNWQRSFLFVYPKEELEFLQVIFLSVVLKEDHKNILSQSYFDIVRRQLLDHFYLIFTGIETRENTLSNLSGLQVFCNLLKILIRETAL